MTGLMCAVKRYVDSSILPLIDTAGRGKKGDKSKKGEEAATGKTGSKSKTTKKKASTWEVLTSSPRILNMTLMVMGYGICHKIFGFIWKVREGGWVLVGVFEHEHLREAQNGARGCQAEE